MPVFQSIANELKKFENNQKQLIEWLLEIGIDKGLTDQTKNGEIQLEEIDPFTFFSMFMKYGEHQRRTYMERILKKLKLNVQPPDDFMGVTSAQAQKVWLFPYKKNRGLNDVPFLWKLFNQGGTCKTIYQSQLSIGYNIIKTVSY